MPFYTDPLNRVIELRETPKRIISLVPSQTELLSDLGLDEEVIAITKFCVHPEHWFRNKIKIGGTKTIDIPKVISLKPDLIIANKEENVKEQIGLLEKIAPVWVSNITTISDALKMIGDIGEITGKKQPAREIVEGIKKEFLKLLTIVSHPNQKKLRTAYLIWKNPLMAAGGGTFIQDMLASNILENVFADEERYPTIDFGELKRRNTELILLSTEPYPFKQKDIDEFSKQLPGIKIVLVNGEMFSWYGSRMLQSAKYFQRLHNILYGDYGKNA